MLEPKVPEQVSFQPMEPCWPKPVFPWKSTAHKLILLNSQPEISGWLFVRQPKKFSPNPRFPLRPLRALGFDATYSTVALDKNLHPLSISPTANNFWNVIVWMDHRAKEQTRRINATHHKELQNSGGKITPETPLPKLLWIKDHLPQSGNSVGIF